MGSGDRRDGLTGHGGQGIVGPGPAKTTKAVTTTAALRAMVTTTTETTARTGTMVITATATAMVALMETARTLLRQVNELLLVLIALQVIGIST
jgi:hypothetical protein